MVKTIKKIFLCSLIMLTAFSCGSSNNQDSFIESATDIINKEDGIKIQKGFIGKDNKISHSPTYVQWGKDSEGIYYLRFATAVKGEIDSLTYTRKAVEGINEGKDKVVEVGTVYRGIAAANKVYFYDDAVGLTTSEEYAKNYYWACYSIKYATGRNYDVNVDLTLSINGEVVSNKVTSLNNELNRGYNLYYESSNGGTITLDKEQATANEEVTVNAVPEIGYALEGIYVNDKLIEGNTFAMPYQETYVYGSFKKDLTEYSVSAVDNRYGRVFVEIDKAISGQLIEIDYMPLNEYVLDYFTVNGENIGTNNTFIMPNEDVVVSAMFKKAIEDTDVVLSSKMNAATAYSYWYFDYTEEGLHVKVKVTDQTLIMYGEPRHQDNVELLVTSYDDASWVKGKTTKFMVTAGGTATIAKAVSKTALSDDKLDLTGYNFTYSSSVKYITNKDGYSGYEIDMLIGYEVLGYNYETGLGNFIVCPAFNNAESSITSRWAYYGEWFVTSTFIRVNSDNSLTL